MFKELSARLEAQFTKLAAAVKTELPALNKLVASRKLAPIKDELPPRAGAGDNHAVRRGRHGRRARRPLAVAMIVLRALCDFRMNMQGVGFRYYTEDLAQREGVSGFVRNLPDGRVEAVVEGDVESVGRVETALWRGPRSARVDDIGIEETTPSGRLTGFRIRA